MANQGRIIVYAAIAGVLAMLGGIVWYSSLDNPQLELVEIKIGQVKVTSVNNIDGSAKLEVGLVVKNPGEKTFTISRIDYELFANGKSLGKSQYSVEDIPMPGRAPFYPKVELELPSTFQLKKSGENADIYDTVINGEQVKYSAKGLAVVESAWSLVEKEFQTSQ